MRNGSWLVVVLVACGGTNPPPQTPSNQVPVTQPQPTTASGLSQEVCAQRAQEFGSISLQADQVALRRGTGAKTFADIATTKSEPIEVCKASGQRAWLRSVTCTDGTNASSSNRSGSVGPGGTCGSVIDLYLVQCPEKEYEVFMDMYMCPPGEGM